MRNYIKFLFVVLLLGASTIATQAQTLFSVLQGKVLVDNAAVADGATVVLLNSQDSSVVKSTICDKSGVFSFNQLKAGNYLVFISKLNYSKSYTGPYQTVVGKTNDIGSILLKPTVKELKEVAVTGKKDFVEVKADRTVLNVGQNIIASGGTLYDLLTTSPGVKIGSNEDILFKGGQRAIIAINGKPVLLSGSELIEFLKNYQSSGINQIELVTNPGAKYGAEGAGGLINIVLKKRADVGSNATITESVAYGQKYKLNTGINYNLRTDKFNLYASYNFADNSILHTINTNRNIYGTGSEVANYDLNYKAYVKSRVHSFNVGFDYQLAKYQTISFFVNGYDNNSAISKNGFTKTTINGVADTAIKSTSTVNRNTNNFNYNLNYKASLDKLSKSVLAVDINYSDYNRRSTENIENDLYAPSSTVANKSILYNVVSPSHITVKSANIDFTQALSKFSHLEFGIKSSKVGSDNQINFAQNKNGSFISVPGYTDYFNYNERVDAGYIQFDNKFSDNTSLTISLRDEKTTSTGISAISSTPVNTSYNDIFPNVVFNQQIGKNNQLTFSYARNIQRPNYQDLNPFISYVDQYFYSIGNPSLKPDYINTYQISDLIADKYKVSFSTIITNNFFESSYGQDAAHAYYSIKQNLGKRYQYLAEFDIPVDITSWWSADADIVLSHERYAYTNGTSKNADGLSFDLNQSFKISSKLTAQLIGEYLSPTYYIISQYKSFYWLNAGLSYSVLNKKGTIRLAFSDIFNTNYNRLTTTYNGLNFTSRDQLGNRFVTTTFIYRFGSKAVKSRSKTTDEQKRLSSE